jgi:glycosyltransferase involved in cell wall biosynthesis
MTICHLNFNKGFRGSGRQTEILIRALAAKGLEQKFAARAKSPLVDRLSGTEGLEIAELGKPFFLHPGVCKGVEVVHAHTGQAAHLAALGHLLHRTPYILTRRVDNPIRGDLFNRLAYRRASRVVALSRVIRERVTDLLPDLDVVTIPDALAELPVDPSEVERLRKKYAGKFLVGHTGELSNHHKGQLYLIQAARRLQTEAPDLHVLLMGHGDDEELFRRESKDLSNVELVGFVDNVGDYLSILDVFTYPSLHEGMGSAIIDAMDFSLPVVATDVDGIPDIVDQEVTGLLVPPKDAEALADAFLKVYRDADLRRSMGLAGKERARLFSPDRMADRYLELYRPFLAK